MSIQCTCPHCGKGFKFADDAAGRSARCKVCQGTFMVPFQVLGAAPPPAPSEPIPLDLVDDAAPSIPAEVIQQHPHNAAGETGDDEVYRKGDLLIIPNDSRLPPRCVHCNATAAGYVPVKLPAQKGVYWLTLLAGVLFIDMSSATVRFPFCRRCMQQRRQQKSAGTMVTVIGTCLIIALVGLNFIVDTGNPPIFIIAAIVTFVLMLVIGVIVRAPNHLSASLLNEEWVWVKGACKEYLEPLPEL